MCEMRRMWPVLVVLVVLVSACRLETNLTIELNADASGTLITELGLDQEMRNLLESFGGGDDLLSGLDLGGGAPTETRIDGEMTYFSATQSFTDLAELDRLVAENQDQAPFERFEISVDEEGALLIAKAAALTEQGGVDVESLPLDPAGLADGAFSANIFVKLPGNVVRHNADEVMADGRLRWAISLTDPLDIEAESSFGGDGVPWLPIGITVVAVLAIGAILLRRNRRDASVDALRATTAPPAPLDFTQPASPEPAPQDGDSAVVGETTRREPPPERPPRADG